MRFFTDSKMQKGSAHTEYESYSRSIWRDLPQDLRMIQGGMLPETMIGADATFLHDGRILSYRGSDDSLSLGIETDVRGDRQILTLNYEGAVLQTDPGLSRFVDNADSRDFDIACHEVTTGKGLYRHQILFSGGEELVVEFSSFNLASHKR